MRRFRFFVATALLAFASIAAADVTSLFGVFNIDNGPTGTIIGTGNPNVAAYCSFNNGVKFTGAASGSAPSVSTVANSLCTSSGDTNQNLNVAGLGTGIVTLGQALCTASGATPQTCNGQRGIVTTNSLATATLTDAAFVINNSSVASTSLIACSNQGYSGTIVTNGLPVFTTCVPGSGTITVHITNFGANALSGTVQIGFAVLN